MLLFNSIKVLIQICQLCGLAPYSMNQDTMKWETNPNLTIFSIVILIYNILIFIITLIFSEFVLNHKNKKMRVLLSAFVLAWNHLHAICAIFESIVKRKHHVKLMNMLNNMNILFQEHLNMQTDYLKLKQSCKRIIMLWICELVAFMGADFFVYFYLNNVHMLRVMIIFIPSYAVCKLSYFYSALLAHLVQENINVLNKYLKSVIKENGYYICETFNNEKKSNRTTYIKTSQVNLRPKTILLMMKIYYQIWEGVETIRYLMCWSLIIGLSNECFLSIFNSWMFCIVIIKDQGLSQCVFAVTLIATVITTVFYLTNSYKKAVEAVSQ